MEIDVTKVDNFSLPKEKHLVKMVEELCRRLVDSAKDCVAVIYQLSKKHAD